MKFILNAHRVLFSLSFREIDWRSPKTWTVVAALLLVAILGGRALFSENEVVQEEAVKQRSVTLGSVGALTSDTTPLPVVGEVTSATEADIRSEAGGRITGVYVKLGDRVAAGRILAETENSGQRAATLQTEGVLDAAKATLAKIKGGTRDEQLAILQSSADSAKGSAVTTLLSAYGSVDSAVNDTADQMFTGIEIGQPTFSIPTSNQQIELELAQRRAALVSTLARQQQATQSISKDSDLKAELTRAEQELRDTRTFIDTILRALADAIVSDTATASEITSYKAAATAARASLTGSLSQVTAARNALDVSAESLSQGVTGAQAEDIAAAEAAVKQAQGAYNAALAALEKTRVRSPISGTVNNLSISTGDFVTPQQQVAVVSNNNALEIVAYVTESDRTSVVPGARALIEGRIEGTVTRVAPALDPISRKIEVRIGIPDEARTLANGQSVRLEIDRSYDALPSADTAIAIPISAVKIEATRTIVFTVDDKNALVAHEVELGPLLGDKVRILKGISYDMFIVTDARGLKEGVIVTISGT